jgi:polyisoprenoid-binding protein YceI
MFPAVLALSLSAFAQEDLSDQEDPDAGLPEVYTFGHQTGRLAALVFESSLTENSGRSHHHVVVATAWSGRLRWSDGMACKGEFKVPVGALLADDPAERKKDDVGPALAESDQKKVNEHLRARDQLYIEKFPVITYAVTQCTLKPDGHHVILGDLTLRGLTQRVALKVTAQESDGTLKLVGEGSINHTDFGFEPYYALFGQRQNQDRMRLTVDVEGMATGPRSSLAAPLIEAAE